MSDIVFNIYFYKNACKETERLGVIYLHSTFLLGLCICYVVEFVMQRTQYFVNPFFLLLNFKKISPRGSYFAFKWQKEQNLKIGKILQNNMSTKSFDDYDHKIGY